MPSYRVTTERLVEADNEAEAAALSARIPPDQWVVYADTYRLVYVVTPQEVADVQAGWEAQVVDVEIVDDDDVPATGTFEVDIDPGEDFTFPQRGEEPFFFKRSGVDLNPYLPPGYAERLSLLDGAIPDE